MQHVEDSMIRRFVLGDLDEEGREAIETAAIADDDLFARIELIEDEIIEEYLSGKLPVSERKIFDETLDTIPGRRLRVELVRAIAARKAPSAERSNVVKFNEQLRFASHARLAIAAGFAAAAITAVIFIQARRSATEGAAPAPAVASTSATSPVPTTAAPGPQVPETSSALAARRPGTPILTNPAAAVESIAATSVVTFLLTTGTVRSGDAARSLDLAPDCEAVDLIVAVDDDAYSHYNAELRAPDGTSVASQREIAVMAVGGAPVIRIRVPASALRSGRHELVLAGVHERGAEEVAYIEFEVRKR